MSELYKMFHKKYYIAFFLLFLVSVLFGVGYFFDLSYMIEGEELAVSALAYCAQMQQLVKNLYFFAVVYISCDAFAGEMEEGQIRTSIVHVCSRGRIALQKYFSLCTVFTIFHVLFWGINFALYCLCMARREIPTRIADRATLVYIEIFAGYLEAFFFCTAAALCVGLFLRKMHSVILVYILWFAFRYADKVMSLKDVFTEFASDYLTDSVSTVSSINSQVYLLNGLGCVLLVCIGLYIFQRKDIA